MPSLRKDLRTDLEKTVIKARDIAEAAATAALQALAVDQAKPFPHMDEDARALRNRLRERGRAAGDVRDDFSATQTLGHLAQLVAYEHWHRMLFARFLAENGMLLEPEHQVALSLADAEELAREEGADLWQLAGSYAQRMLPEVFRNDDPALAVTLAREDRVKLEKLLADLDPATFTATDSLGWTYQFWQTKRKKQVNDSGVKIGADEISPVTQLFTEDYMVDFLLDNTVGAWHAGKILAANPMLAASARSEDDLRQACALPGCAWNYLRFGKPDTSSGDAANESKSSIDNHQSTIPWSPAAGTFDGWPKNAADLKCLDPCMGSGHFVVAIFERLVALRMAEENIDERAAVTGVIRDNLYGLEIDPRCTQIAAFNMALAAWRRVGHCKLPAMNLACSGLAPNSAEADWLAIAGDNTKLQRGMERLYRLFQNASILGSLISPRAGAGDLVEAAFHELQPLLEKALAQETQDDNAHEMAVTARGLAKAAEILAGQFTLVATNVPYLGAKKQDDALQGHCVRAHPDAKSDLATCFVERCLDFCADGGSTTLVTPQNWLFLSTYKNLRQKLLKEVQWDVVIRLGEHAFESAQAAGAFAALLGLSKKRATEGSNLVAIDAAAEKSPELKADSLQKSIPIHVAQSGQLGNPDARITFELSGDLQLLEVLATNHQGLSTGDNPRFCRSFWEVAAFGSKWEAEQSTVESAEPYGGRSGILLWEGGRGELYKFGRENVEALHNVDRRGEEAWGQQGVAIAQMRELPTTLYGGQKFDTNAAVIIPKNRSHLLAIWTYCSSPEFHSCVRRIDQKVNVTNATLVKVPFDLAHWQKLAAEKYPDGLPMPFSSDPTQWLFNGHPAGSDQPLHVAVARLLGYRWPRQTGSEFPDCSALGPDGLESFCDEDGIVCLTPLRGEAKAAERLRKLLDAAHGDAGWNERQLLAATGAKSTQLEDWLRDEFFEQHAKLFHHRAFIWHIWDGRPDGFHALVNYHQLAAPDGAGHKLLETLTYAYLGDWIRRQKSDAANGVPGAESRLEAAEVLEQELKHILGGEPPYDLFIRWKPLHQQPIGWHPDINDGVRLNIRPFLCAKDVKKKDAGILRWRPNIKWTKDRGTEPQRPKSDFPWFWTWDEKTRDFPGSAKFDGCRWNDLHYRNETKQAARAAHEKKGSEA
jgi:hypothetical protein